MHGQQNIKKKVNESVWEHIAWEIIWNVKILINLRMNVVVM